jgi:hypothetical protein
VGHVGEFKGEFLKAMIVFGVFIEKGVLVFKRV